MANNAPKDTSLHSTKQMLDELDSLMERMLSLPVNDLDDLANAKETPKGPSLAESLTLLGTPAAPSSATTEVKQEPVSIPAPAPTKKPIERRQRVKLPHLPVQPPHIKNQPAKVDTPTPASMPEPGPAPSPGQPVPLSNDVEPPTVLPNLGPLLAQAPETPVLPAPSAAAPIVWVNQVFDRSTMSLGGLGKWLRGVAGRTFLGYVGIAFLLIAAGWVIKDWLGWN